MTSDVFNLFAAIAPLLSEVSPKLNDPFVRVWSAKKSIDSGLKIGPNPTASREKRGIVVGWIVEAGLMLDTFEVWTNSGRETDQDYHKTMDSDLFHQYLSKNLPKIKEAAGDRQAIFAIDNVVYHNKQAEKITAADNPRYKGGNFWVLLKHGVESELGATKANLFYDLECFYEFPGPAESLLWLESMSHLSTYGDSLSNIPVKAQSYRIDPTNVSYTENTVPFVSEENDLDEDE